MKNLKTYLSLAVLAVILVSTRNSALAQTPTYAPQVLTIPATVPATTTTNLASPPTIDIRKQSTCFVQISCAQLSASTSNSLFRFQRSVDGITWDTNTFKDIQIGAAGSTVITINTNLAYDGWASGAGYVRLYSIANTPSITIMTNLAAQYAVKISAP